MKWKHFDFVGNKKIFFCISLALFAVILIVSLIFGVKMDVAFKGGSITTYNYTGTLDFNELENQVQSIVGEVKVNQKAGIAGGSNSFDIVSTTDDGIDAEKQNQLSVLLTEKYGDQLELLSNSSVNPVIGREFFIKGLAAVLFASIVLVVYIGFRFKKIKGMSAGVASVVALVHDVIMVFGAFVIFGIPLDDNFIAVLLTILGYSINDTIVIYDRLRENQKLYGKTMSPGKLMNKSINETMTRTLGTSCAVLGTLVVVCVVALVSNVPSIISFAFPMLIGAISGTYSSIFIAGPLWVMWQEFKAKKEKQDKVAHHYHK